MSNVKALKNLAAVVCGVDVSTVHGTTTAEVIQFIADNYPQTEAADNGETET